MARKVREMDELLTQAGLDPRAKMIILEIAERMNVQHQQINALAEHQGKLIDMLTDTQNQMGGLGNKLDKLGITDEIKKMNQQDDDPDDTHTHSRRRRH